MASNYPSGLDTFTNPAGTDNLAAGIGHAAQHDNINDAVRAVEVELGTTPKGSDASVAARLTRLDANGFVTPIRTSGGYSDQATSYTLTNNDFVVDMSGTSTATLPTSVGNAGRRFTIRNNGAATVTIATTGGQLIDGAATLVLAGKGFAEVVADGTGWHVLTAQYTDESVGRRIFTWNHAYSTGGGWQLTYSDTGWRDVSANINTPNGFTAGSIFVRRTGYTVALGVYGLARAAGGAGDYYTFLAGWCCAVPVYGRSFSNNPWYAYGSSAYINMAGTSESGAGTLFSTSDAWPVSLPGTPSGSIPNA